MASDASEPQEEPSLPVALVALAAVAAASIDLFATRAAVPLRVVVAIPLLAAPGYILAAALFPPGTLRSSERLAVSGGLGLAVVVLLGFVLDVLPGGLSRSSWSVGLGVVAVAGAVAADGPPTRRHARVRLRSRPSLGAILLGAIGLLVLLAALGIARQRAAARDATERFTQLSATPLETAGRPTAVRIGVTNDERATTRYVVVVRDPRGRALLRTRPFALGSGDSWTRTWRPPSGRAVASATVDLYRGRVGPRAYRSTRVQLRP